MLRFLASPQEIVGDDRVRGVRVVDNELVAQADGSLTARAGTDSTVLDAGLVLRSIGYRGQALPGLPFDELAGIIPNHEGRVCDAAGTSLPGTYVCGWLKRGPRGVIGTNKLCSHETIARLLDDARAGLLPAPDAGAAELDALLAARQPQRIDYRGWRLIDEH